MLPEKSGSDLKIKTGSRLSRIRFYIGIVIMNEIRELPGSFRDWVSMPVRL